jgi:sec-independent protein translocase protein TatC
MSAALAHAYVPPDEDQDPPGGQMSFLDHLEELRRRILHAVYAIAAGMIVAGAFIERITRFVLAPARRALPPGVDIVYLHPGESFGFYFEVAMLAGVVIAAPAVVYQVWLFIAPGLYAREKRLVIPFVLLATCGLVGGAAFGHYVMFASMMRFLASFHGPDLKFMPRLDDVFRMYTLTIAGMATVFQIPTVVFFAARMGVVTAGFLARHFKYAVLGIFVIAAVVTPSSDPWNQTLFALPMIALYLVSIGIAWAVSPRPARRRQPARRPPASRARR